MCYVVTGSDPREQIAQEWQILNYLAELLIGQPQLGVLKVRKTRFHVEEFGDHQLGPSAKSAIQHFANAVQTHLSLRFIEWGRPNGWTEQGAQAVVRALSAALQQNSRIMKLDVSSYLLSRHTLPQLLQGARHLWELLLPLHVMKKDEVDVVASWVDKTLNIERIGFDVKSSILHRCLPLTGLFKRIYSGLIRNKIAHHAYKVMNAHPSIPVVAWPCLFAKLGSNGKEGTPLFLFLKNSAHSLLEEFWICNQPNRKRRSNTQLR